MWQLFLRGLALIAAAGLAVSFAGAIHPAGDSLAVFRVGLVAVLLAACLLAFRWKFSMVLAAFGAWAAIDLTLIRAGEAATSGAPDIVVYQKNMHYSDYEGAWLAQDIWASGARIVTLQEVSDAHRDFLAIMADTHPHQLICEGTAVGAIVVLSTDPSVVRTCSEPAGMAVMDVAAFGGTTRVRVVSLHMHWPWPFSQAAELDAMLENLEAADLDRFGPAEHVIVGGDFNMVPWGHSVRRIERFFDVSRVGQLESTFSLYGWHLPIDHVLAGPVAAGQSTVRPDLGSDHKGVVADVTFNRP